MSLSDGLFDAADGIIRYLTKGWNYPEDVKERCWKLIDEIDDINWARESGLAFMPGGTEEQWREGRE